jgi:hypothetical protein
MSVSSPSRKAALLGAMLVALAAPSARAESSDFLQPDWGSGFVSCPGEKTAMRLRASMGDSNLAGRGIITCRDAGDNYVYAVDYMNFALTKYSTWKSAHLEWFGNAAQRAGAGGRNDWFYDDARPIRVQVDGLKPASISNLSFAVPKATLSQARGFGFYIVGGGVFWSLTNLSRDWQGEQSAEQGPLGALALPSGASDKSASSTQKNELQLRRRGPGEVLALVERPQWGTGFSTCAGAGTPMPLKAASADNDNLLANGVINCTDAGDAYLYTVDYLNVSLAPGSKWTSAHLEWFGCGVQREGKEGRNDWIFEEAKPIKLTLAAGAKRAAISGVSCRVPKNALQQARGFGFYVVGGGILWSILLL